MARVPSSNWFKELLTKQFKFLPPRLKLTVGRLALAFRRLLKQVEWKNEDLSYTRNTDRGILDRTDSDDDVITGRERRISRRNAKTKPKPK